MFNVQWWGKLMIQLKSIAGADFLEKKFAVLVEPDVAGKVTNDSELNAAIAQSGGAIVCEFDKDFKLGPRIHLTPREFANTWIGD
jgi:hypothetical protein